MRGRGLDWKVACERIKGKRPTILGVEFGEKVLCKTKLGSKLEKINARWEYGIFVGVRRRSNELMVATVEGIRNCGEVSEEDSGVKKVGRGLCGLG